MLYSEKKALLNTGAAMNRVYMIAGRHMAGVDQRMENIVVVNIFTMVLTDMTTAHFIGDIMKNSQNAQEIYFR